MKCPICKIKIIAKTKSWPFCSQRCKDIDLYNWLNGEYTYFDEEEAAPLKFVDPEEDVPEKFWSN